MASCEKAQGGQEERLTLEVSRVGDDGRELLELVEGGRHLVVG
mgnify:CR=1 FL=1